MFNKINKGVRVEFTIRASILKFDNEFTNLCGVYVNGIFEEVLKIRRQPSIGQSRKRIGKSEVNQDFRNFAMVQTKRGWHLCYLPYGPHGVINDISPAKAYKFFNGNFCALQDKCNGKWVIYYYNRNSSKLVDEVYENDTLWQSEFVDEVKLQQDFNRRKRIIVRKGDTWILTEIKDEWRSNILSENNFSGGYAEEFKYPDILFWYKNVKELPLVRMDKGIRLLGGQSYLSSYYYDVYFIGNLIADLTKKHLFIGFSLDIKNCMPYLLYLREHKKFGEMTHIDSFSKEWKQIPSLGTTKENYHRLYFLSDSIENPLSPRSLGFQSSDSHRYMYLTAPGKIKYFSIKGNQLKEFPGEFMNGSPFSPYLDWTLVNVNIKKAKEHKLTDITKEEKKKGFILCKYYEDGKVERYIEPKNDVEELQEVKK